MESELKTVEAEALMASLLELVEQGGTVPLVISGNSMNPFLVHHRDTVYLSKVENPLKKGDMILYRRRSGAYGLHRICKVRQDSFDLVGDAQISIETGIRPDQVLALVTAVRRKGTLLREDSFCWWFFRRVWLCLIPLRQRILNLYGALRRKR